MAITLDISQSAYHRKEAGIYHFKMEELEQLAGLFGVPVWELSWNEKKEESFRQFARQKGYVSENSNRNRVTVLEGALREKEEMITELKKDIEFLRHRIDTLQNDTITG